MRKAYRMYTPIPGKPITPDCSDGGLIFEHDGHGGGKLFRPVHLAEGRIARGRLVAKVRCWK